MSLLHLTLSEITTAQILSLKEDRVAESRDLDFKRDYNLSGDREKREFACDVAAFANTVGGDLLFGVDEIDGVASAIPGISSFKGDEERLRIENLLSTGVSPRIAGLGFKVVPLENGNSIFIVRIPRSLNAPHMVTYNGDFRFYGRHSSGRFPMDVNQIRDSFSSGDLISGGLKAFRERRIHWIQHNEVGVRLPSPHLVVIHLLPLAALRGTELFDGRSMQKIDATKLAPLRHAGGYGPQHNLDGMRIHSSMPDKSIIGYVQLFRTGCLEVVDADMLGGDRNTIYQTYEIEVRDGVHRLIQTMRELRIEGPIAIGLSLLQVKNFNMGLINRRPIYAGHPVEHENLLLPEAVINNDASPSEIDAALRSSFDLVWNACGYLGSPSYNSEGTWAPKE